jgi:hypothetical protein
LEAEKTQLLADKTALEAEKTQLLADKATLEAEKTQLLADKAALQVSMRDIYVNQITANLDSLNTMLQPNTALTSVSTSWDVFVETL